jgi:hypothetical protein
VEEQFALPQRIHIEYIALLIGADVHADHPRLSPTDGNVAILQITLALTDAFDLCTEKSDARFVFFVYEIVVICFFILRYDFSSLLFVISHGDILLSFI